MDSDQNSDESENNSPPHSINANDSPRYSPPYSPTYSPGRRDYSPSPSIERMSYKRRRKVEEDRLSNLPKSLILLILSFLSAKQAVRTTVLSKRWRSFWPYIPVLDFQYRDNPTQLKNVSCMQPFVSFVNHVLIFYQSLKLDAFRVCMDYKRIFAHDVDVWLLFATRKCVEEVEIDFTESRFVSYDSSDDDDGRDRDEDDVDCYVAPVFMFSNASLVRLKLMRCEIKYRGTINWKSLKVLSLSEIGMGNDLLRSILSGSPSLEVLELLDCSDYDIVNIKHERLRRFVMNDYSKHLGVDKHTEVEISAPFIKSLEISGTLNARKVLLIDCSSLVEAKIDFGKAEPSRGEDDKECEKILREILGKLRHVRNLTVGSRCLQVLTRMRDHDVSFQASSCKCLTLLTQLATGKGIAILLRSSPLLQTLHIDMTSDKCENYYRRDYDEDSLLALDNEPALKTLKIVTISGLVQQAYYYKRLIPIAKSLLKNAKVLEKMVITPQKDDNWRHRENDNTDELLDLALKLLSLPRSSLKAVIELSR